MKKYRVSSPDNQDVSELELNNRNLARRIATEGLVLLENNGVLPIDINTKIALFGTGARMTVFGGSGSGETKGREKVSIESGLKNVGFSIASNRWMDRFDEKYKVEYETWKNEINQKMKGYTIFNVVQMFEVIGRNPFSFPIGQPIEEIDMEGDADIAIYVLARQAGEGDDRKVEPGSYLLTNQEILTIRTLRKHYKKLIVILNCGSSIDLSFLDEISVDALLYMGQPGEEAGNAVADILIGAESPSGKLTSTWGFHYEDYPSAKSFGESGKEAFEADYQEGIFVGYRYFEAKGIAPRYAFGFGKGYTDFAITFNGMRQEKEKLLFSFTVENIGDIYSGKEVVQVYVSKPDNLMQQEKKALAGFAKTKDLKPKEKQIIVIEVNINHISSFCDDNTEKLLRGFYAFSVGNASDNVKPTVILEVEEPVNLKKVSVTSGTSRFSDIQIEMAEKNVELSSECFADVPLVVLDSSGLKCADVMRNCVYEALDQRAIEIAKKLTNKEISKLIVGANVTGVGFNRSPGAVGKTTSALIKKYRIPNINMADGPAGLNLLPESIISRFGIEQCYDHLPESWSFGFLSKLSRIAIGNPNTGRCVFQYCTAFPSTTVRAQSWNVDLIYSVGVAVGQEMKRFGITLWLAPALNIQRNPLCGRNFEYVSEDPILSGKLAAAITKGVQSVGGVGATIKHFCCNNQEYQREYVSSNVSIRALREIYLRGFEIAVKESQPWAVMTSYNKLNGTYTANNKELITDILRKEWGFKGIVMTDWRAITDKKGKISQCAQAGNDIIMPGEPYISKAIFTDLQSGKLSRSDAMNAAARILELILKSNVAEI